MLHHHSFWAAGPTCSAIPAENRASHGRMTPSSPHRFRIRRYIFSSLVDRDAMVYSIVNYTKQGHVTYTNLYSHLQKFIFSPLQCIFKTLIFKDLELFHSTAFEITSTKVLPLNFTYRPIFIDRSITIMAHNLY